MVSLIEQRSQEWFEARHGKITASRFREVFEGGPAQWVRLLNEIREAIPGDKYAGETAEWGRLNEPRARALYELETGNVVEEVGFVLHCDHPFIGCSPDGIIPTDDGVIEIKCPANPEKHRATRLYGMDVREHGPQVYGQLWVTGANWCDFVSFDPRARGEDRLYVQRVFPDPEYIQRLAAKVTEFADHLAHGTEPNIPDLLSGRPQLF